MNNINISVKNVHHQVIKSTDVERHFLTLNLNEVDHKHEILGQYKELLLEIKSLGLSPVYEKIFGSDNLLHSFAEIKYEVFEKAYPTGLVNYETITRVPISSIYIFAVKENKEKGNYVVPLSTKSIKLVTEDVEHYYFMGTPPVEKDPFEGVFEYLDNCLKTNSLPSSSIVRTWFYVRDIEKYYPKFNESRRLFFDRNDIAYGNEAPKLPSSTCISAKIPLDELIQGDMYCLLQQNDTVAVNRMYNKNQNEANGTTYQFHPTFARATEVIAPEYTEVQISGTASINAKGESIHLNDPYHQIHTTLNHIAHLLAQQNMNFENLIQSTCFFKDRSYYAIFEKVVEDMGVPKFSSTFVVGDVCRDELLFEMDGIAIKLNK